MLNLKLMLVPMSSLPNTFFEPTPGESAAMFNVRGRRASKSRWAIQ